MNELLFGNKQEKEALENILALNQIKICDSEIDRYTEEIKELNYEMTDILREEDINEDYVEKIHKYKRVLSSLEGENGRLKELDSKIEDNEKRIKEFQDKAKEIESKLESLKQEIFETSNPSKVIECQNEIETNNAKLNEINEILNKLVGDNTPLLIEKEYLAAKNNGVEFNIPNFNKEEIQNDLDRITNIFNGQIEKLDLPVRENIEFCQKKIKNREAEIEKFTARKNKVIESFPNSVNLDISSAYADIEELLNDLGLTTGFENYDNSSMFDEEDIEIEEDTPNLFDEPESVTEEVEENMDNTDSKEEPSFFKEPENVNQYEEEPIMPEISLTEPKEVKKRSS